MKKIIVFLFTLFSCTLAQAQHEAEAAAVIKEGIVSKKVVFDYSKREKVYCVLEVTYLGGIKQKSGRILKFATIESTCGISRRGSSRLYIYNGDIKYLGQYRVSTSQSKVIGNKLIFKQKNEGRDFVTKIDFYNKIPKEIFIKYNKEVGDISEFE